MKEDIHTLKLVLEQLEWHRLISKARGFDVSSNDKLIAEYKERIRLAQSNEENRYGQG